MTEQTQCLAGKLLQQFRILKFSFIFLWASASMQDPADKENFNLILNRKLSQFAYLFPKKSNPTMPKQAKLKQIQVKAKQSIEFPFYFCFGCFLPKNCNQRKRNPACPLLFFH